MAYHLPDMSSYDQTSIFSRSDHRVSSTDCYSDVFVELVLSVANAVRGRELREQLRTRGSPSVVWSEWGAPRAPQGLEHDIPYRSGLPRHYMSVRSIQISLGFPPCPWAIVDCPIDPNHLSDLSLSSYSLGSNKEDFTIPSR